jgi:MFS family permease
MSTALAPTALAANPTASAAVWTGLIGLAVAMGIGRFAFTPVLPLMQQDAGISLVQGSWLATANYVGYLVGALICISSPPPPARAIQWGLVSIACFTLGMGLTHELSLWLALRFLAGAASGFVLVGVSAWAMPVLAQLRQPRRSGEVFAGVCRRYFHGHHDGGNTGSAAPRWVAVSAGGGPLYGGVRARADCRTVDGQSVSRWAAAAQFACCAGAGGEQPHTWSDRACRR